MKKTFLVLVAAVLAGTAFSQVKYGVQVMGNAGTAKIESDAIVTSSSSMKVGMGAGFVAEYPVSKHFSVRGSLNWLQKQNKFEYLTPISATHEFMVTSHLNYIELPLHASYQLPLNNMTIFVGIGPSFGYGFTGKLKVNGWVETGGIGDEIIITPLSTEVDAFDKDGDDGGDMKRFEISGSAIAGVSFKNGLFVHAGYLHGFTNLIKDDGTYRNRGLLLTVGFMIGK